MLGDARILICHYDANEAQRLRFALRKLGADARAVVTVRDALATFDVWRPDAVLSGRVATTPTGYDCELLRALRGRERDGGLHVPVVATTPWRGVEAREPLLALGFDGHVGAPCTPERIAEELSRIALRRAAAAGARASAAAGPFARK